MPPVDGRMGCCEPGPFDSAALPSSRTMSRLSETTSSPISRSGTVDLPLPPLASSLRRRNSLGLSARSMISCVKGVSSSSSAIHTRWEGAVRVCDACIAQAHAWHDCG